jgi:alpha-tubulin suppressor-like RCC1 family protein
MLLLETLLSIKPASTVEERFLYTWGRNAYAAIPSTLAEEFSWTAVSTNAANIFGIRSDGKLYGWGSNQYGRLGTDVNVGGTFPSPTPIASDASWSAVSAGSGHVLALRTDGKLFAWGLNNYGQVGDGTLTNKSSPVQVGNSSWTAISTLTNYNLAIRSDGALFAWGRNNYGQVGDNSATTKSSPVQLGTSSWTSIGAGFLTSAAVRSDGALFMWGNQTYFGDYRLGGVSSPIQIGTKTWSKVNVGLSNFAAIDSDQKLYTWGQNQVSIGVPQTAASWTAVSHGTYRVLAIRSDGLLFAWGAPAAQMGDGLTGGSGVPFKFSPIQIGTSSWTAVSTGKRHTLGITADGKLFAWGTNNNGELGDGTTTFKTTPIQIGNDNWSKVNAAGYGSIAIRADGKLFTWGEGSTIGDGTYVAKSSPVQIGTDSWIDISQGRSQATAIRADGALFTWGRSPFNTLELYKSETFSWTAISNSLSRTVAIRSDGGLFIWGSIDPVFGSSLGVNSTSSPVQIGTSSWTAVAAGLVHIAAIRTDGSLFTVGGNGYGQLGDGTSVARTAFYQVPGSWAAIAAGGAHNLALDSAGRLFAWGSNGNGQLGNNSTLGSSTPTLIGPFTWSKISAAEIPTNQGRSLAIRSDGLLFAWGSNDIGHLGDGTTVNKSSPVQIGTSSWTAVSSGRYISAAIRADGALFTWGGNSNGQLGDGTTVNKSSPVQIGTSSWSAVSAGDQHAIAVTSDGRLFSWGRNPNGNLGDGTVSNKSSPVSVSSGSWTAVSNTIDAGNAITFAVDVTGRLFAWGSNLNGNLGLGAVAGVGYESVPILLGNRTVTESRVPWQIGTSSWTAVSSSDIHHLAIRSDGALFAWGQGASGQLGNGSLVSRSSPVQIGNFSWTAVSAGNGVQSSTAFSHAIRIDGSLFGWGVNDTNSGAVGNNGVTAVVSPVQIGVGNSYTALASGSNFGGAFAIRSTGLLDGWGGFSNVALVDARIAFNNPIRIPTTFGTTFENYNLPVKVNDDNWTDVSAGPAMFAVRNDGALFAWGVNSSSVLGNNDPNAINVSSPVQIGTSSWTAVASKFGNIPSTFATMISSDGKLYQTGRASGFTNTVIEDGFTSLASSVPTLIASYTRTTVTPTLNNELSWIAISAGTSHAAAIRSDYKLFTWGQNVYGQLGNNTVAPSSSPVQVGTSSWTAVSVGGFHTVGILSTGAGFAWGRANQGQLGAGGPTTNRSSPVAITGSHLWRSLSAGTYHTVGVRKDGRLLAFGRGTEGQLGNGSSGSVSSPSLIGTSNWTVASAGFNHSLAIDASKRLFSFGRNNFSQLGDGTTTARSSPVQIGTSSWTAVAAGSVHSVAIRSDKMLFAWGRNHYGQLGTPPTVEYSWTAISNGTTHVAAIRSDGALFAWGSNSFGQLGDNTTVAKSSPVQIGTSSWTAVAAGTGHTVAIRQDGALFTWGQGTSGQLGNGSLVSRSSPVQVGTSSWTAVSTGRYHTLAIRTDGALFAWGIGTGGQLGDNTGTSRSSPVQIGTSSWTAISAGVYHNLAIRSDSALFAWGRNSVFQTLPEAQDYSWSTISSAYGITAAIRSDGALFTWGRNSYGQLGQNSTSNLSVPTQVGSSSWTAVSAGGLHMIAVRADGGLFAWGRNNYGQLGDATTVGKSSPVQIGTSSWTAVSTGRNHSAAIRFNNTGSAGLVFTWGRNTYGNLGTGGGGAGQTAPYSTGLSAKAIVSGENYNLAIRSDDRLVGWGQNTLGQLGNGTASNVFAPTVIGNDTWTSIFANSRSNHSAGINSNSKLYLWGNNNYGQTTGFYRESWAILSGGFGHAAGITSDGKLFTWGANGSGQLGNGATTNTTTISQIGTSSWTAVAVGRSFTVAIRADGALFTWGQGTSGQLGDGTNISKSSPVQIGTSSWTAVTAGSYQAAAIRLGGNLFTWGQNGFGQLGDGTVTIRSSPVQIGANSWNAVSMIATTHTVAIRADGALFTWGLGTSGQLGDGTIISKSSPVQIGTSSWTAISAGVNNTYAITSDNKLFAWGLNASGELGVQQNSTVSWSLVSSGERHTLAIRSDGALFSWGQNNNGQLGIGNTNGTFSPTQIGTSSWTAVSAGRYHTLAIRLGGSLFAWGFNSSGQLGDGTNANRSSPVQIGTSSWTAVSVGEQHSTAIRADGALFTWGLNNYGQRGTNAVTPQQWNHVEVGWAGDAAGAIRSNGSLFMWGNNGTGQLGDGTTVTKSSPVQIGTSSWTAVSIGTAQTYAIDLSGRLFVWGAGGNGRLGLGDSTNRSSPVQIGTDLYSAVDAGDSFGAAIRQDGALFTWGLNNRGQLGDNTLANKTSPVQVGTSSWTAVSTGRYHTLAIRSDGALFAWGQGTSGELGDGTIVNKSSPVQIGTSSWTAVSAGRVHSLAITADGRLFSWGTNASGQLGDNTLVGKSSPVQVGASLPLTWSKIYAGASCSVAISSTGVPFGFGGQAGLYAPGTGVVTFSAPTILPAVESQLPVEFAIKANIANTPIFRRLNSGFLYVSTGAANNAAGVNALISLPSPTLVGARSQDNSFSPVQVGTSSWSAITSGRNHNLALTSAGSLFAWGKNNYGQVGNSVAAGGTGSSAANLTLAEYDPVQIGANTWNKISAGGDSSSAIRSDGALFTWGRNNYGNLGIGRVGDLARNSSPVQVGTGTWSDISMGGARAFGVTTSGQLFGWGSNQNTKVISTTAPNISVNISVPTQIGSDSNWDKVVVSKQGNLGGVAGECAIFATKTDGQLFSFGGGNSSVMEGIVGGATNIQVAAFAIRTPIKFGTIPAFVNSPVQVGTNDNWTSVSAGNGSVHALRNDGILFGWGTNNNNQLGNTHYRDIVVNGLSTPAALTSAVELFPTQIDNTPYVKLGVEALGVGSQVAIKSDGNAFTWGVVSAPVGTVTQTGSVILSPTIVGSAAPSAVTTPKLVDNNSWIAISVRETSTFGIRSDGIMYAWGNNTSTGIVTFGNSVAPGIYPLSGGQTLAGDSARTWSKIAAGVQHTIAVDSFGKLYSWGADANAGSLGNASNVTRSSPVQISSAVRTSTFFSPVQIGTSSWTAVAAGRYHSAAIRSDGALFTWGSNSSGQVGNGTVINAFAVTKLNNESWTAVAAGWDSTLAVRLDGGLYAWGLNNIGQLGDGTQTNRLLPVKIGNSSWTAVSVGTTSTTSAIRSGGSLFQWGLNNYGQVGDTSLINRSSPVQIGGGSVSANSPTQVNSSLEWSRVTAGNLTTVATDVDGRLFAWGRNATGQLGIGTLQDVNSPTLVSADSWTLISAGGVATLATRE